MQHQPFFISGGRGCSIEPSMTFLVHHAFRNVHHGLQESSRENRAVGCVLVRRPIPFRILIAGSIADPSSVRVRWHRQALQKRESGGSMCLAQARQGEPDPDSARHDLSGDVVGPADHLSLQRLSTRPCGEVDQVSALRQRQRPLISKHAAERSGGGNDLNGRRRDPGVRDHYLL